MTTIERKFLPLAIRAEYKVESTCRRIISKLKENTADGYMDTLIKILIAVVLGVALLAALKTFIIDKFFPELETQIMDMFNGTSAGSGGGEAAPGT